MNSNMEQDRHEKTCCHHSKSETGGKKKTKKPINIYDTNRVPKIKNDNATRNPEFYLERAKVFDSRNCLSQAFESFIHYFEALEDPSSAPADIRTRFTQVMIKLSGMFETDNNDEEAIKCYLKVINLFPKNAVVLNLFGVHMFQRGEYNIAKVYLDQGSKLEFLPADRNLLHVLWHQIPRWHFRMLNDHERNRKYASAIQRAIEKGARQVYDIGAGCGLLSLISLSCHDDVKVCAFEQSQALSQMLVKIVDKKGFSDRITVFDKYSTDFDGCESADNVGCDLIVTEVFDVCLFGERALETLNHAIKTFVRTGQSYKIIPSRAKIYVTGIESSSLSKKYKFFGDSGRGDFLGLNEGFCLKVLADELYEAEILTDSNSKYVTNTCQFIEVDFCDTNQLEELIKGNSLERVTLDVVENGSIDFLAVWFDLILDSETVLSTDPRSPITCWEQGIFHLDRPMKVQKGHKVIVKPVIVDNQLNFEFGSCESNQCWAVSKDVITFLNDSKLTEAIEKLADCLKLDYRIRILDLAQFPLFGLLAAKRGATVYHIYKEDSNDLDFVRYLVKINNLDPKHFILVPQQCGQLFRNELHFLDYVFEDFVGPDGSWCKTSPYLAELSRLKPKLIPERVYLNLQLIQSDYLDFGNKVDDSKALGLGIGEFMNEYTGSEHPGLENFEFSALSTVSTIDVTNLETLEFRTQVSGLCEGLSNGILYWFDLNYSHDITFSTFDSWHYSKSCALFNKEARFVRIGDVVEIKAQRFENYMKISCIS